MKRVIFLSFLWSVAVVVIPFGIWGVFLDAGNYQNLTGLNSVGISPKQGSVQAPRRDEKNHEWTGGHGGGAPAPAAAAPATGATAAGITSSGLVGISLAAVVVIFGLDIAVMWALTKLGGEKLKADVKATINKFGGSIVIAGAGLVGCFLAIAFVGFGGLYLVASIMSK